MYSWTARACGKTITDECATAETRVECALVGAAIVTALVSTHGIFSFASVLKAAGTIAEGVAVGAGAAVGERVGFLVDKFASGYPQGRGEREKILKSPVVQEQRAEEITKPPLANAITPG